LLEVSTPEEKIDANKSDRQRHTKLETNEGGTLVSSRVDVAVQTKACLPQRQISSLDDGWAIPEFRCGLTPLGPTLEPVRLDGLSRQR
jgi:hypothetical protein